MTFAQLLTSYFSLNLLLAFAYVVLRLSDATMKRSHRLFSSRQQLSLHYALLASIVGITILQPAFPKGEIFQPTAKIWSAPSIKTFSEDYLGRGGFIALPSPSGARAIEADLAAFLMLSIFALVAMVGMFRLGKDVHSLRIIHRSSYLVRRIGRVAVRANDHIRVPFSYWLPFRAEVVIPSPLLSRASDYRISLAHELQHHRQSDTLWVYPLCALRIICAPNPVIHLWSRWLSQIQEFACDESLLGRNKVKSQQYARCLIEVAQSALHKEHNPACATGLVFLVERNLLKRRIERMFSSKPIWNARSINWAVGTVVVALMATTAYASQNLVEDRRVSLSEAQLMAAKARTETDFPIVVNDLVLKELNRYVGTPEGRKYMRKSLERMQNYRPLVEGKIKDYQMPPEIAAIPIMESGYRNLEQSSNAAWGAGLWMFIKSTARNYGLRVDDHVDERMNVELETDAAMRYLKAGKLLFDDWLLSILGYGHGETEVQKLIDQTGSRDAWTLVRAGFSSQPTYLSKVMAAVIIMKNPESVQ
ncbi:MAG: M56 and MltD domain-containing protein [Oligoflexia bacterium]|nr:M56 and MltD domain-containing protein [Oligoflexia bacterium]